jgi:hypothetical protein
MAKVWFAKSGNDPTRGEANFVLTLARCIERLGLDRSHYLQGLDETPRFDRPSSADAFTAPRHVVVELETIEASVAGWKSGFYSLADLSISQAEKLLTD